MADLTERQAIEIVVLALEKLQGRFSEADVMARVAELIGRWPHEEMVEDVVDTLNSSRGDVLDQLSLVPGRPGRKAEPWRP